MHLAFILQHHPMNNTMEPEGIKDQSKDHEKATPELVIPSAEPLAKDVVLQSRGASTESTTSADTQQNTSASMVNRIQTLSLEDATKESERAAEKIKQKTRPLSKVNAARRSIAQTFQQDDSTNTDRQRESLAEPFSSGDETEEDVLSRAASIPTTEGPLERPSTEGTSRARRGVSRRRVKKPKESGLIILEEPRLIDARTAREDRRFFQCAGDPEPEGDVVYDFLYQHQRGAFFLGTPKFGAKSLLPVDPDEWTDSQFETSPMDITDYELPDPSWEWVHKSWLVDMTGDVDEDGWEYAMTFHGSPWHGNYEIFRSFARRRRWLRLRKRKGKSASHPGSPPERLYPTSVSASTWSKVDASQAHLEDPSPFPVVNPDGSAGSLPKQTTPVAAVDLYKILKKARSDREKLAYTAQYVVLYPGDFDDLEKRLDNYLNLFDYETSRRDFLALLCTYGRTNTAQAALDRLQFYSDKKKLAESTQSLLL